MAFSGRPEIDEVTHVAKDQVVTAEDRVVVARVPCEVDNLFVTTVDEKKGLTNQPKPLGK